ncbi:MAG: glutamate--tRNA ligase [Flavobacteriaceae bacterium]|nr:glutamate--tRNA ligase [Flavobacteriaceae bacterium]
MKSDVRVRFAPSPTGPLHIGGVRTALFNYLFAKKHKGQFVLRIEDTDQNRYVPGAEEYIIEALEWCGIPFDEGPGKGGEFGPYRQSERKSLYRQYADELVSGGHAYYAFDTPEILNSHRKDHESKGKTFIYNAHNRLKLDNSLSLDADALEKRLKEGQSYVIRFKTPESGIISFQDIIRGVIEIKTTTLDDKILFKSDGMPTYHLANVVDDHLMQISHVIRGEEWLPSLALHVQLYWAFGWDVPVFAHLPLIMKPVGKGKLSKRDGEKMGFPVFPLSWEESIGYREAGYYPETVVNFLAMLGWNPGTEQEIFSLNELVQAFDLDRVHHSGARFDPEKTAWFNHHYLQQRSGDELLREYKGMLQSNEVDVSKYTDDYLMRLLNLIKERASFNHELYDLSEFFFHAPTEFESKAVKRGWKEQSPERLQDLIALFESIDFNNASISEAVNSYIKEHDISFGAVMPTMRMLLVGDLKGPGVFEIMELLGKEEVISRMRFALSHFS